MSDIGFPNNQQQKKPQLNMQGQAEEVPRRPVKTGEIITAEQVQRMMNT